MLTLGVFKRLLVAFWWLWWLIAFLTDFLGGLKELGVITAAWLPHTNYPFLAKSLAPYDAPVWLPPVLFAGIVLWSFLSTVLFTVAMCTPRQPEMRWRHRVDTAFIVSLGLWLAFFIADQVVMKFDLEENHMVQGGFELLCLMAIRLLPDNPSE
jgi:hypothetical protein